VYPKDICQSQVVECEAVYNLVVDREHIVFINGIPVILLGHSYTQGILRHDYLGSQKVIQDLERMLGWNSGHIVLNGDCALRKNRKLTRFVNNR